MLPHLIVSLFMVREKVRRLANMYHMTLTEDKSEATPITHASVNSDTDTYCRPVFKMDQKCLVQFNALSGRTFKGFFLLA